MHGCGEQITILKIRCGTAAIEQSLLVEVLEPLDELVAETDAQYCNGKQEGRMRCGYPALTTQWIWERSRMLELQVCRMEKKPISASRRFGSAAISSKAWELAAQRVDQQPTP
jgi:hypothetical protein